MGETIRRLVLPVEERNRGSASARTAQRHNASESIRPEEIACRGASLGTKIRVTPGRGLGPPGQGGERIARALGIGSAAGRDVGRTLEALRTSLTRLEQEIDDLTLIVRRAVIASSSADLDHQRVIELPRAPRTTDRDYWLAHCDHFTVYAGERIVGAVEGMRFRSRIDRPDLLEVRCGHLGRRLLLVPVDDVAFVEPQERMVVLQAARPIQGIRVFIRLRLDRLRTPPRPLLH